MINAFTEKGKLILPGDGSIQVKYSNPLTQTIGSQSVPVSLPYIEENLTVLDHPERIQSRDRYKTSRTAYLQMDPFFQVGKLRLFQCSRAEGLPATFYFGGGSLYSDMSDALLMTDLPWPTRDPFSGTVTEKATQWLDYLTKVYCKEITEDYDLFPLVYSYTANTGAYVNVSQVFLTWYSLNALTWVSNTQCSFTAYSVQTEIDGSEYTTLPVGYGVTPFLKVSYVLRKLFAMLGYTLLTNIFDTDPALQHLVELNNTADAIVNGKLQEVQLVPDMTVKDYLKAVSNRFNVQFVPDCVKKTITVWSWNDALSTAPDMDLTPLICADEKIEYVDPEPLELTESTGIALTSTPYDRYSKFLAKYPTCSTLLNNILQAYFLDGTLLSSNFFGQVPTGTATESISAGDSAIPMVGVSINDSVTDGILYHPYVGSRRHMNSQLTLAGALVIEDKINLDLMFCFAVPALQQSSFTQNGETFTYSYYMGTPSCYDSQGNKWGALTLGYFGDNGTYNTYFATRDEVKTKSYHSITVDLALTPSLLNQIVNGLHIQKLYKNQPVFIDTMQVDMGATIGTTEIVLRTIKHYLDVATDIYAIRWDNFVCELVASDMKPNILTLTCAANTTLIVQSQYPVASDISICVNWETDYILIGSSNFSSTNGTSIIAIPKGQSTGQAIVNSESNEYLRIPACTIESITPSLDDTYQYYVSTAPAIGTNSGYQRTLCIAIDITYTNGYIATNEYDGKIAFSMNGNTYQVITNAQLMSLTVADFNARLTDWIAYFNANYLPGFPGITVDASGARVYNTTSCPLS